jgi:hypothetical protein
MLTRLVASGDDADRFANFVASLVDVLEGTLLQADRKLIAFFVLDILVSLVQEFHGAMQAAGPIQTGVDRDVIVDVFAIFHGGLLDFVDGLIDLVNRFFFFVLQLTVIGTFEVDASSAKIGKSVQIRGMTALRGRITRCNRKE